jgi:hypothetical protein
MANHFICVYASNLAGATGHHKHIKPHVVLEEMWSKIDPTGYTAAFHRNSKKTKEERLQEIFQAGGKLAKHVADATTKQHDTSNGTLNTAKTAIAAMCKMSDLSNDDKILLSEHIQTNVFTKYGTDQEERVYRALIEKHSLAIKKDPVFYRKKMGEINGKAWFIGGKVDAVTQDRSQVVEIKNRVGELKKIVRSYELVQLQCYMQLLGIDHSTLAECYTAPDGSMHIDTSLVEKDQQFWDSQVMPRITAFIALLIDLLHAVTVQNGYLRENNPEEFV